MRCVISGILIHHRAVYFPEWWVLTDLSGKNHKETRLCWTMSHHIMWFSGCAAKNPTLSWTLLTNACFLLFGQQAPLMKLKINWFNVGKLPPLEVLVWSDRIHLLWSILSLVSNPISRHFFFNFIKVTNPSTHTFVCVCVTLCFAACFCRVRFVSSHLGTLALVDGVTLSAVEFSCNLCRNVYWQQTSLVVKSKRWF